MSRKSGETWGTPDELVGVTARLKAAPFQGNADPKPT